MKVPDTRWEKLFWVKERHKLRHNSSFRISSSRVFRGSLHLSCSSDQMLLFKWPTRIVPLIFQHGLAPHKLTLRLSYSEKCFTNDNWLVKRTVSRQSTIKVLKTECWSQGLRISCSAFWSYPSWPALTAKRRHWLRYPNFISILTGYSCAPFLCLTFSLSCCIEPIRFRMASFSGWQSACHDGSVMPEVTPQPTTGLMTSLLEYQSHNYTHQKQATAHLCKFIH